MQIYKWLIYYAFSIRQKLDTSFLSKLEISSNVKKELIIFFTELLEKKYISQSGDPDLLFQIKISLEENYFSSMLSYEYTGELYDQALEIFLKLSIDKSEKRYLHTCLALRCFNNLDAGCMLSHLNCIKELGNTGTRFKLDPLLILEVIYHMTVSGDRDPLQIESLVTYITDSVLFISSDFEPYDHFLHSLILSFIPVTNQPQVSLAVLGVLNTDIRRSLLAVRHHSI